MTKILLFGIDGYGSGYVRALLGHKEELDAEIVAAIDPFAAEASIAKIAPAPVFKDSDAYLASGIAADICVISTPIALHAQQAVWAMEHGMHVLLEKPIAPDVASAMRIKEARERTGKYCSIGFQLCFDEPMRNMKRDILAGKFGKPVKCKSITLWPRGFRYYGRSTGWAGKRVDKEGRLTLDSVASNATAHYLMNMLWILGDTMECAAPLENVRCEVARANAIETFDTIELTGTANDVPITYIASHAIEPTSSIEPTLEYTFEKGIVRFVMEGDRNIVATMTDGETVYPDVTIGDNDMYIKIKSFLRCLRENIMPPCPIETALEHTKVMDIVNALPVREMPSQMTANKDALFVEGLAAKCKADFEKA